MIKNASYGVYEERYFDCPYCGVMISDYSNLNEGDEIVEGNIIHCPKCKKTIRIVGERG